MPIVLISHIRWMQACDSSRVWIVSSSNIILRVVDPPNLRRIIQKKMLSSKNSFVLGMWLQENNIWFSMKYILPIILTFLINFPNCGMVFSSEMSMMDHHIDGEMVSMNMDEVHGDVSHHPNIQSWMYDCCPNASRGILERNTVPSFSLENISTDISYVYVFSYVEPTANTRKYPTQIYRPDSPPDPSEYISLIGNSVKTLN